MRRAGAILLILGLGLLGGCLGATAGDDSFQFIPRTITPDAPALYRLGRAEVLGVAQLKSSRQWFGGISGFSFDGRTVTAINDAGHWLHFDLRLDPEGRPVGASNLEIAPLGGLDGSKDDGDAEDVAWTPVGWLVSFERRHRLLLYPDGLSGQPVRQHAPEGIERQPNNGGLEAVARLRDGRLLLLSEEGADSGGGWGWIGTPGAWSRVSYHREGAFQPTAAAQLPDGDILVTERRFTLIGGVALRLVRLPLADLKPGAAITGQEVLRLEPPLLVDNFEGLAIHQRADGRAVAYIMSDDNFNPLQATLLLAVLLPR